MKKTIMSLLIMCILLSTLFVPVYATSPEEEAPRITVTVIDQKTGEDLSHILTPPTEHIIETGLSQSELLNLTAEEQHEISLAYLNSLPQTRSHTHKWVWKGSQYTPVNVTVNGVTFTVLGWLIQHECSICGDTQDTLQI